MVPPAGLDPPPSIEIDGRRFYADRCYLNAMAGRDDDAAPHPPDIQIFSRRRLVAALSSEILEACILTTYSVDVPDLEADFPALFGPGSDVPTLLLHGDKRVRRGYAETPEGPYKVWKEVVDNPNVEKSRGKERTPHWEYPAMDARIQVGGWVGGRVFGVGPFYRPNHDPQFSHKNHPKIIRCSRSSPTFVTSPTPPRPRGAWVPSIPRCASSSRARPSSWWSQPPTWGRRPLWTSRGCSRSPADGSRRHSSMAAPALDAR